MTRTSLVLAAALAASSCGGRRSPHGPHAALGDPNAVLLEGALGNRYVDAGSAAEVVARMRIDTRAVGEAIRPPINLALVIDTSGSMEGEPIEHARAAALALVDSLAMGDRLAVVVFHSTTEVLVPATKLDARSLAKVRERVGAMKARGTTDMAGGLSAGLQQVSSGLNQGGVNRIVLLSDGVPNEEASIVPLAQAARQNGVAISALGLGVDYNETLLAQVALESGGRFHYIEDTREVAEVFHKEVLRLQRVVARNLVLQLMPGPGIDVKAVVGQAANAGGNRSLYVSLGDLSEGEQRDVILRLGVAGHRDGAAIELMDAVLTFDDALHGAGRLERRVYLSARATKDASKLLDGRDPDVERSAARAAAAAATLDAIALARAGRVADGSALLDRAQAEARAAAVRFADDELAARAEAMTALREALPTLPPPLPPPAPVVEAYSDKADEMVSPGGESPAPAPPPPLASPEAAGTVRSTHSDAMKTLQNH